VRLCNLGGLAEIARLQKQECGDGPGIILGACGDLRPTSRAFRRKNMGNELVASSILLTSPKGRLFVAAMLIGVGERRRALAENDHKRFHGSGRLVGIHTSRYRASDTANCKKSAFYFGMDWRKNVSGVLPVARRKS